MQVNTKAGKSGIFLLAFTTTLREGLETAVFITGSNTASGAASIPLAGLVGVICGLIVGMLLFYTCARLCAAVNLVLAAGICTTL